MKKTIRDYPLKIYPQNSDVFLISDDNNVVQTVSLDSLKTFVGVNNWIMTNMNLDLSSGYKLVAQALSHDLTLTLPSANNSNIGDEILIVTNVTQPYKVTIDRNDQLINNLSNNISIYSNMRISLIKSVDSWLLNFFESGIDGININNISFIDNNQSILNKNSTKINCFFSSDTIYTEQTQINGDIV